MADLVSSARNATAGSGAGGRGQGMCVARLGITGNWFFVSAKAVERGYLSNRLPSISGAFLHEPITLLPPERWTMLL